MSNQTVGPVSAGHTDRASAEIGRKPVRCPAYGSGPFWQAGASARPGAVHGVRLLRVLHSPTILPDGPRGCRSSQV